MSVVVLWSLGVGRALAHRLISCEGLPSLGLPGDGARVTNHCEFCGSTEHGRPLLTSTLGVVMPYVSISYAEDLTVVALTQSSPVGVDVERCDAASFPGFDAIVAHEQESFPDARARTMTWTRKESLLKATGQGLTVDPRQILLTEPSELPRLVDWTGVDPADTSVWMLDVEVTSAHVAAVTVLSKVRPELVVRRVDLAGLVDQAARAQSARP